MNKENNKGFGLSDLLMIFAIVNWGLNFSIVKIAFREFSPHAFNGLRLLVTSLILMAILGVSRAGFSLPRRELGMAIVIGIVGNTGYQFLFAHPVSDARVCGHDERPVEVRTSPLGGLGRNFYLVPGSLSGHRQR
jgi:hypothetical protein